MLGEYSYGGTPSYIPNLEVKPIYADGTWLEAAWESMDLPSYFLREASASLSFYPIPPRSAPAINATSAKRQYTYLPAG